jgi:hypothetical protein
MVDAAWLFDKEDYSDAQLVIVEEEADAQAAATGGERAITASKRSGSGNGDACADTGSNSDDDTQAAADNSEQPELAAKRGRVEGSSEGQVVLPIHRAIVMSASEFCKARLGAWQSDTEPCRVLLHVPAGQAEMGRRLVRAMYEDAPSFDDLGSEQQVRLLRLADRYGAPKVAKAAAAAGIDVADMSSQGLAWAAVRAAFPAASYAAAESLPPPAAALRQYAADALQELFGDLEAVWASVDEGEQRSSLLALPFEALKALLEDDRTRVASENTVAHTIERWVAQNKSTLVSLQAEELLPLVRVARLTPHYARTVFCESALAKAHLSAGERTLASMAPLMGDEALGNLRSHAHWCLPARPRSALADAVVLQWCATLAEVEKLVAAPAGGEGSSHIDGPKGVVWQGWPLFVQMYCDRSARGGVTLGLYLTVELPCQAAGALVEHTFEAVAVEGGNGITTSVDLTPLTLITREWGSPDFFHLGKASGDGNTAPPKDWAGMEAALRAKGLVHGEGEAAHLKLRCKVTRLE